MVHPGQLINTRAFATKQHSNIIVLAGERWRTRDEPDTSPTRQTWPTTTGTHFIRCGRQGNNYHLDYRRQTTTRVALTWPVLRALDRPPSLFNTKF